MVSIHVSLPYLNPGKVWGRQRFPLYRLTLPFLSVAFNTDILISQDVQDFKLSSKPSRDKPKRHFHKLYQTQKAKRTADLVSTAVENH